MPVARTVVVTKDAPLPAAPISQAVRSGGLIFVSGITPFDIDLNIAVGDFDAQFRQIMANIEAILAAGDSDLDRVLKCTVILARRSDWRRMNALYAAYWTEGQYPARTAFEALLPHPDFLVEVECVAEAGPR